MSSLSPAPRIRPRPCVGGLMDIPLGRYYKGKYGDNLLSGGFGMFTLGGGRGNTFKTTLLLSQAMTILDRYPEAKFELYDTELTFSWDRIEDLAIRYPGIDFETDVESGRIIVSSAGEHTGDEYWKILSDRSDERAKNFKRESVETPFIDANGVPVRVLTPIISFLDSISQFEVEAILEMHRKNDIDDSAMQTDQMRSSGFKSRMIQRIPAVTARGGIHMIMTAHVGDEIKIDPYAPAKQLLQFLKKGLKFKNTPEKASFLSSVTWYISSAEVKAGPDKCLIYPAAGFKDIVGDTDLQELNVINARSKSGPAGHVLNVLVSQTEGRLSGLSEFDFLKSRKDKFGLEGPEGVSKDWRLAIYPEALLKRKQVRDMIDNDPKLARALEITSEMCQIYEYWVDFPRDRVVTPKDLYEKLKADGHDWDVLLDTRGYWTYDHYTNPVKPLSTMDFIDMYHGDYIPWWYTKEQKDKLKVKPDGKTKDESTGA